MTDNPSGDLLDDYELANERIDKLVASANELLASLSILLLIRENVRQETLFDGIIVMLKEKGEALREVVKEAKGEQK